MKLFRVFTILPLLISCYFCGYSPTLLAQSNAYYNTPTTNLDEELGEDELYYRPPKTSFQPLNYKPLREADVLWQKRIWQNIDTRPAQNYRFVHPNAPFVKILWDIAAQHPDKALIFADGNFEQSTDIYALTNNLQLVDTISVYDIDQSVYIPKIIHNDFDWTSVKKYRIKEDWVFDASCSRVRTRIIGIAPIIDIYDDYGNKRGERALFWLYYPSFRPFLANAQAFSPEYQAVSLSWDDVLELRLFDSTIAKVSNLDDTYFTGKDALYESEKARQQIKSFEQNLWHD